MHQRLLGILVQYWTIIFQLINQVFVSFEQSAGLSPFELLYVEGGSKLTALIGGELWTSLDTFLTCRVVQETRLTSASRANLIFFDRF